MRNESTRFFFVVCLAHDKSHFGGVPGLNLNHHLHRGARVKAGTHVAGQLFLFHRYRITQGAVASNESGAISGKRSRRWSRSYKSDAIAKFRIVRIAGEQSLAL